MSTRRLRTQPRGFRGEPLEGGDSPGRRKNDEVGHRPRGGCTAERTVLEVVMRRGMMMMRMMFRRRGVGGGTQLQLKRGTACRHEPDRDVGSK